MQSMMINHTFIILYIPFLCCNGKFITAVCTQVYTYNILMCLITLFKANVLSELVTFYSTVLILLTTVGEENWAIKWHYFILFLTCLGF